MAKYTEDVEEKKYKDFIMEVPNNPSDNHLKIFDKGLKENSKNSILGIVLGFFLILLGIAIALLDFTTDFFIAKKIEIINFNLEDAVIPLSFFLIIIGLIIMIFFRLNIKVSRKKNKS